MREETNSITHLVKIVSKEVFGDLLGKQFAHFKKQLDRLESKSRNESTESIDLIEGIAQNYFHDLRSSLDNAGDHWTEEENFLLMKEVGIAIAQIAKNHHRSNKAITMKIAAGNFF